MNENLGFVQWFRVAPQWKCLVIDSHGIGVEDLFDGQLEEGDDVVVVARVAHVDLELFVQRIDAEQLSDVLERRIGLVHQRSCFRLIAFDFDATVRIRFATRLLRALQATIAIR